MNPRTTEGETGSVRRDHLQFWTRRAFLRGSAAVGLTALVALAGDQEWQRRRPAAPAQQSTISPRPTPAGFTVGVPATPLVPATTVSDSTPLPRVAAAQSGKGASATTGSRAPNVLLVTIDTLRADRIGAYGYAQAHTPVLDQFARDGVRFDHAICQLPQTNASHAALMTGLYASTNGVKVHMVDRLSPDIPTLASIFQSAGYQTAGLYSWVSLDPQFCGLNQGFETYEGYVINRGLVFSNPAVEQLAATYRQLKAEVPILSTADVVLGASSDYEATLDGRADVTNAAVFDWLDAHVDSGPFFLWVHYFDPHYPYAPPKGYDHILGLDYQGTIDGSVDTIHKLQQRQLVPNAADLARLEELYQGEIAFVDAQLGQLLGRLTKLGIADDTIVTVTGDHGESFGEHGDWAHGWKVYESEIRVPLLMRYPRRLPAGAQVKVPTQLIDVAPTLLDLTGLTAKQSIQGTSLIPVVGADADGSDRVAFTELADDSFVSVLTWGDWKLIRNDANGQLQLYNLKLDEAEQRDLLQDDPQTTAEMSARLQDLMKISGVSR